MSEVFKCEFCQIGNMYVGFCALLNVCITDSLVTKQPHIGFCLCKYTDVAASYVLDRLAHIENC